MKTLYLDCFSGISGDMMLGALLDINDGEKELREGLSLLGLDDQFELIIEKTQKSGVTGTKVTVRLTDEEETHGEEHGHSHEHAHDHSGHTHEHAHDHEQHTHVHEGHAHEHGHSNETPHVHKGLTDIANLINGSTLPAEVKETAVKIFTHLAEAEAHVHGTAPDDVHFHEVGAVDAIVDIVGTSILFHRLAPDTTICGPVNLGSGFVKCAHGLFPVPAPAVAQILRGLPVFMGPGKGELTTPTGAAILYTLCDSAEPLPKMEVGRVGYGLGQRDMETLNALRAFAGILKNG